MEKNKIMIIALIVIIAALLVGIVAVMPNTAKKDTKLTFKSNSTLTEGDSLKIKLTDENKTAIANQTVNITITNKDKSKDYHTVVTNDKGIGTLKLEKSPGKYNVTVTYNGNDNYAGCNATKMIAIEEKVVESQTTSSSSSQSSSQSSNTHTIMGEDGYYYVVDDNGNHIQTLGPSQKYYPNNPNSVNYPNAESGAKYIDKSK